MALTKEDLQAIQQLIQPLQDGQTALRADMVELKTDVAKLETDVRKLSQTVAKIEVDHGQKLTAIYDAHIDTVRNATTIQELDAKVDSHDHRIFALEMAVSNK